MAVARRRAAAWARLSRDELSQQPQRLGAPPLRLAAAPPLARLFSRRHQPLPARHLALRALHALGLRYLCLTPRRLLLPQQLPLTARIVVGAQTRLPVRGICGESTLSGAERIDCARCSRAP
tara:strand:+ start:416 stop:781 length:366 start_codon:yes stop_codon:yes gene_type:complete